MITRIIKFEAPWCGQCKALDRQLSKVSIPVEHINVEEEEDAVDKYNIKNLPTMLFMDGDTEVDRVSGIMTAETINQKIKDLDE